MIYLDLLTAISNGLGGGFAILWALFGVRTLIHTWEITEADPAIRASAWNWWRAGIVIMAVTMAAPYNLENILRAEGLINPLESIVLLNLAHLGHCAALCILLTGLDIACGGRSHSIIAYAFLIPICAAGGLVLHDY